MVILTGRMKPRRSRVRPDETAVLKRGALPFLEGKPAAEDGMDSFRGGEGRADIGAEAEKGAFGEVEGAGFEVSDDPIATEF
jgi:hypothetical protein